MTRRQFATRILVIAGFWASLQVYVGLRLLGAVPGGSAALVAGAGIPALALLPFAAVFAGRLERVPLRGVIEWAGFTALGLSSLLIVFFLITDLLHLGSWLDPRVVSGGVLASALTILVIGGWRARRPAVVKVEVPIANLPRDLQGFRIVQLSDLHVGSTLKREFVEQVVRAANRLEPDLIALTGDVADGFPQALQDDVAPLSRLAAPHGKFYVTGNHEYYWDAPGWVKEVERLGFEVLVNAHRVVSRGAARLLIAGVTDRSAGGATPGHASDPRAAVAGAPVADVKVLLAHQPTSAFAARSAGFDLQLSGHTHGGQYFPFNVLVRLFQPFVAGLHRLEAMWLYVSRGTGYWGPPLRFGAPSEITLIELVRA